MKCLVLFLVGLVAMATAGSATLYARVSIPGRTSASDHIVAIDRMTGATKDIMKTFVYSVPSDSYYGLSTMDRSGVYYYTTGGSPFSSYVSRASIESQTIQYPSAIPLDQIISLTYDETQSRLFVAGVSYDAFPKQTLGTTLVSWPTSQDSYPVAYAQLDGDSSFISTTGVIDSPNQLYYWIAMPNPKTILLKWISTATSNGQVNSVQLKCNNPLSPLSMSFDSVRQQLLFYGGLYSSNTQQFTLYINVVDASGNCQAIQTSVYYTKYVSAFGYDEVNQVLYVSVDSTLYSLNARTGAMINTVTIANGYVPYSLNVH